MIKSLDGHCSPEMFSSYPTISFIPVTLDSRFHTLFFSDVWLVDFKCLDDTSWGKKTQFAAQICG